MLNWALVRGKVGRISVNLPPNVELNDLINDGILGLIDAIGKFDDSRGVKFESYASPASTVRFWMPCVH